jgi:hypothetical protein
MMSYDLQMESQCFVCSYCNARPKILAQQIVGLKRRLQVVLTGFLPSFDTQRCSISLPGAWRLPKTSEAMTSLLVVFLPFSQLGAALTVIHVTM